MGKEVKGQLAKLRLVEDVHCNSVKTQLHKSREVLFQNVKRMTQEESG